MTMTMTMTTATMTMTTTTLMMTMRKTISLEEYVWEYSLGEHWGLSTSEWPKVPPHCAFPLRFPLLLFLSSPLLLFLSFGSSSCSCSRSRSRPRLSALLR